MFIWIHLWSKIDIRFSHAIASSLSAMMPRWCGVHSMLLIFYVCSRQCKIVVTAYLGSTAHSLPTTYIFHWPALPTGLKDQSSNMWLAVLIIQNLLFTMMWWWWSIDNTLHMYIFLQVCEIKHNLFTNHRPTIKVIPQ